jgi:co-chaperonin GroES (HSP10)
MLKPLFNNVLLEKKQKPTVSGLIADTAETSKLVVVAVGKDVEELKKGDTVIIGNPAAYTKVIDGKTYVIIEDRNLIAIE